MARRGSNPAQFNEDLPPYGVIRLIVPVYLPSLEGYFADGLRVFEAMLASILATTNQRVQVTVIDNACAPEVATSLNEHVRAGRIDRLVRNASNRGKVDAVLSELRATFEPVAVVVDADVAFRPGWVDATLAALEAFPECGMLSLHPAPDFRWHASSSLLMSAGAARARLCRASVVDPADLDRFAQSVGRGATAQPPEGQLLVTRGDAALMLGFGHFAFAVRREVVGDLPAGPSRSTLDGVDVHYFEAPADRAGWWCASVVRALVHHIGNRLDDEETLRIASFVASDVIDHASQTAPAGSAPRWSWLPSPVRRLSVRAGREIERRRFLARWLLPPRNLQMVPSSASRLAASSNREHPGA
ncbi:MAG: glycosyltransferase [Aquihabitans sp.]